MQPSQASTRGLSSAPVAGCAAGLLQKKQSIGKPPHFLETRRSVELRFTVLQTVSFPEPRVVGIIAAMNMFALLIAIIGALVYAFAGNPKLARIGEILFFVGALWFVQSMTAHAIRFG